MEHKIINCYELDVKQDFPKDLSLAQEKCKSLQQTNKVIMIALIIVGVGSSVVFIFKRIKEKTEKRTLLKPKNVLQY